MPLSRSTAVFLLDDIAGRCGECEQEADFVRDYAHGVGFRVGSGGEWIAESEEAE
jgi:hypothetical protein